VSYFQTFRLQFYVYIFLIYTLYMLCAPPILALGDGPNTSVTNRTTLRNISEDRLSQPHSGGSLKSHGALHCSTISVPLLLPSLQVQVFPQHSVLDILSPGYFLKAKDYVPWSYKFFLSLKGSCCRPAMYGVLDVCYSHFEQRDEVPVL
jgi:hypothetical protein